MNEQVEELPHASVAVAVTVVTPTENVLPEGGEETTFGTPVQLSVAVTVKETMLLHAPRIMFAGHVTVGAVTSTVHVNN